jgi:D-ribose pyranose/furanose isomerase RbsD
MGHDDLIIVCDAGFPIVYREEHKVIDLALAPNIPDLFTVLRVLRQEFWVEKYAFIDQAPDNNPFVVNNVNKIFPDAEGTTMPNSWFHEEGYQTAKYIVRTGAWTPWGNVALWSGIPVKEWFDSTQAEVPEDWKERYEKNEKYGMDGLEFVNKTS